MIVVFIGMHARSLARLFIRWLLMIDGDVGGDFVLTGRNWTGSGWRGRDERGGSEVSEGVNELARFWDTGRRGLDLQMRDQKKK